MKTSPDLFGYISIPKDEITKVGSVEVFIRTQSQLPLNMSADEPYMFRPDMDLVDREIYEVCYHLDDSKLIKTEVSSAEVVKFVFYKEGNWGEIAKMDTMTSKGGWGFETVTRWLNKPNRYIKGISKIGG